MNGLWRPRRRLFRFLLLLSAASLPTAAAADMLVVSQNTLHLGQGSRAVSNYIANKYAFIRALAHWPGNALPQLTFLQEVMPQADAALIEPAGGTAYFGALKGSSTYVERYASVVVNDGGRHLSVLCRVDTASLIGAGVSIQRPPDATLVGDTSSGSPRLLWFLNFHATFGTGSAGTAARRAEIAALGTIVARLRAAAPAGCPRTSDNAVLLGDWNMDAADASFRALAANAGFARLAAVPNEPTSLNARGARSSRYDHFVYDDARIEVRPAALPAGQLCGTRATFAAGILTPASLPNFRRNCSDHLGIAAVVRVRSTSPPRRGRAPRSSS